MSETGIKNGGGPAPCLEAKGTGTANSVSTSESINVCPECGGPLRFGSRDPCEGDYYWCQVCGAGPVCFPAGTCPRAYVIDAESVQRKAFTRKYQAVL